MITNRIMNLIQVTRQHGNTSALIGCLLQNPNANMLVGNYATARELSKKYNIDIGRFINIMDPSALVGKKLNGPLLVDLSVLPLLIEEVKKECNNSYKGVTYNGRRWVTSAGYDSDSVASLIHSYPDQLTDDDFQPLMDLKMNPWKNNNEV